MTETRDKVIIETELRGADQVKTGLKGIEAGLDGVQREAEETSKSTGAVDSKFAALERRFGTTAGHAEQFAKIQKSVNDAVAKNPALQDRANEVLANAGARYVAAAKATDAIAKSSGLARHELVNLSRQFQDVAVSLGSGQSFSTVLLQQGTQIMDVLGTSQGGVRGAVSDLATRFGRLFSVGRVAFGGIAASVGTAAFALNDYLEVQRSVERSLIGTARRSGASASDIEGIAQRGGANSDRSVSETRDAAIEFAKVGSIHKSVIEEMVATTRNFAIVTGQSSKEAAASLAGAFTNIQGIDALNKQFNFLDGNARRAIEVLLLAGRTTEAAALANQRLAESLRGAEGTLSGTERGWQAVTKAVSDYWTLLGEVTARQLNLKPLDTSEQVAQLEANLERIRKIREGLAERGRPTDSSDAAISRITAQIEALNAARQKNAQNQDLNKLSVDAQKAVSALDPLRTKLDEVVGKLTQLKDAQAQGINIPGLQAAVDLYSQIAEHLQNQMQAQDALAAKYPGMSAEFAKQVESLKDQNALLKARQNGTEATTAAAIAYKNAIAAGANETEAAALKTETLKNNLLQASSAASNMTIQLGQAADLDWSEFDAAVSREVQAQRDYDPTAAGSFDVPAGKQYESFVYSPAGLFRAGEKQAADELEANRKAMENLRSSVDDLEKSAETLNETMQKSVTLNPLYNGRDALKVGYYKAAAGLDMIAQGPTTGDQMPFHAMVNGGERITITPAGQTANDNSKTTVVNNTINIGGSSSTSRRSKRQFAQGYGQIMASLS